MSLKSEQEPPYLPEIRVFTFGEFTLERLVTSPTEPDQPRYECVSSEMWQSRGTAISLLKVLLCKQRRRSSRDELLDALWPEDEQAKMKNVGHAFDAAVSILRSVLLCQQAVVYARLANDNDTLSAALNGLAVAFKYAGQPEASFTRIKKPLLIALRPHHYCALVFMLALPQHSHNEGAHKKHSSTLATPTSIFLNIQKMIHFSRLLTTVYLCLRTIKVSCVLL
jgi:hypothetical protein